MKCRRHFFRDKSINIENLLEFDFLTFQSPLSEFSGSGKKKVGRRVQGCFYRVLNNSDDETYGNNLHGDIIGDTEQGAGLMIQVTTVEIPSATCHFYRESHTCENGNNSS